MTKHIAHHFGTCSNTNCTGYAVDNINSALELTISLAEQNVVDRYDNPAEYRRQMAALRLVKETFNRGDRL